MNYYLRRTVKVMLWSLYVWLFVSCLPVSNIPKKNAWTSLHEIYSKGRTWYKEKSELLCSD